ncbi:MAG: 16S rRNA (cytosine(967)-C(5))-methyltransferase RsmB [Ignavibacterium sp.]|nr:16S rRNA (cytosine(967)-C(5))-methyltransferase RsmB [Ignavibacterium sp.]
MDINENNNLVEKPVDDEEIIPSDITAGIKLPLEEHRVVDLYTGVRGLAVKILNRIEKTDAYLDKLIDFELKNSELSGQDKALLFEIVHGVVRWMGRLDWILNGFYKGQFAKGIPDLKNGLRVALYQVFFLDKIPDYAAVNEAVEFVKKLQGQKVANISNAILRNILKAKDGIRYPNPDEDLIGYLSAYYSHPSWMIKRYLERFGREETEKLLLANNEKPSLTLRINSLKTNQEEFLRLLDSVNLKYRVGKYNSDFVKLLNLTNITAWEYFSKGYFSIQDESTGFSCKLLDVIPGMRVLDMCAAPGGKSAYIADLMKDKGEIIALDKFESRLKLLEKNNERLGIKSITPVVADALEFKDAPFDRILLDAPCTGTGTLSKKPDIKWKKDIFDVKKMSEHQLKLLQKAATLVKPGGIIVYSTCSIEEEENFQVVKKFLESNPDFQLKPANGLLPDDVIDDQGCVQTFPHKHQMDGVFAAKLVKVN